MRRVLVAGLLIVALGACRVDAVVRIDMHEDGSGAVTVHIALDADAVRAAEVDGGTLETRVRLGDLEATGWRVSKWQRSEDGAVVTLRHPFSTPEEGAALVTALDGEHGPLRDVELDRDVGAFRGRWSFRGAGDARELGTGLTDDAELVARLTNERVDVAGLDAALARQVQEAFHLRVTVSLPNAAPKAFPVPVGKRVVMATSSSDVDYSHVAMLVAGLALGALALLLLAVGEGRRFADRPGRGVSRS